MVMNIEAWSNLGFVGKYLGERERERVSRWQRGEKEMLGVDFCCQFLQQVLVNNCQLNLIVVLGSMVIRFGDHGGDVGDFRVGKERGKEDGASLAFNA